MWAIGNGESRLLVSIKDLKGPKVGCNAIHRDHHIDHLICVDRRMMDEALHHNSNLNTILYTRPEWYQRYHGFLHVRKVPELPYQGTERWDESFQWGSGPYAVLLSAMFTKIKKVNLIGFDLHSKTKTINNIYKGTPNYDDINHRAIDPRYWIHQIGMVFKCFPETIFTIYQEMDWQLPTTWNQPNVKVDNINKIS